MHGERREEAGSRKELGRERKAGGKRCIQCMYSKAGGCVVLFPGPIRMPLCVPPDQILSSNSHAATVVHSYFSLSVVRQNSIPFTNHDCVAQTGSLNTSSGSGTSNKIQYEKRLLHACRHVLSVKCIQKGGKQACLCVYQCHFGYSKHGHI